MNNKYKKLSAVLAVLIAICLAILAFADFKAVVIYSVVAIKNPSVVLMLREAKAKKKIITKQRISSDLYISVNGEKQKFYNQKGKRIFTVKSDIMPIQLEQEFLLFQYKNKFFILDKKGKKVIKDEYQQLGKDDASKYDVVVKIKGDSYLFIKKDNKYGVIKPNGEFTIQCEYEDINVERRNQSGFWAKKDGKWGKLNLENEVEIDFNFDNMPYFSGKDYVIITVKKEAVKEGERSDEEHLKKEIKMHQEIKQREEENRLKTIKKVEGELHYVGVIEGCYDYKMKEKPSDIVLGKVTVNTEITDKPITLLLTSIYPVEWTVKSDNPNNIKKIYFCSGHDSMVIAPSSKIPVEQLSCYGLSDTLGVDISKYLDKSPVTYQFPHKPKFVFIDGKQGADYKKREKMTSTDKDVRFIAPNNQIIKPIISKDGLNLSSDSKLDYFIKANKYYSKGKYYLEVQLKSAVGSSDITTPWRTNIGIVSPMNAKSHCSIGANSGERCTSYSFLNMDRNKIKNNDIFGIALDFDNGKFYISKNGKWYKSNPQTQETIYEILNDGREYTIGAIGTNQNQWLFNFGSKKFKYDMPKDFKPFDEYSAQKNKVNLK